MPTVLPDFLKSLKSLVTGNQHTVSQFLSSFYESKGGVHVPKIVLEQHSFDYDDMTDGGGATGTYVFPFTIPIGAQYIGTTYVNITGFTGDTSATLVIGDGTDADRYNTGTPSVFTTATMVAAGAPSGTIVHATAISTVTATVTSASDFTSVAAGSVTVGFNWIEWS